MAIKAPILVTGCAGFIGYHLSQRLLEAGYQVTGIDNLNDYYDVALKQTRLQRLQNHEHFSFYKISIEDRDKMDELFALNHFSVIVHLAAQVGVRNSLVNPHAYIETNVMGFTNVLECCRKYPVEQVIYASSSSVYGGNTKMPLSTSDAVNHPVSLYAATKKANELMAHTYSHLYGISTTGLRFFTVYGPWGRPDMAYFSFTNAILTGKPIQVYNRGRMKRDFTYIDDIIDGIVRLISKKAQPDPDWNGQHPDPSSSTAPYKIYNIGNQAPVDLLHFIEVLEDKLGRKAEKQFLPMQAGDVVETFADVSDFIKDVGFKPSTSIEDGIGHFVDWYKAYYLKS